MQPWPSTLYAMSASPCATSTLAPFARRALDAFTVAASKACGL